MFVLPAPGSSEPSFFFKIIPSDSVSKRFFGSDFNASTFMICFREEKKPKIQLDSGLQRKKHFIAAAANNRFKSRHALHCIGSSMYVLVLVLVLVLGPGSWALQAPQVESISYITLKPTLGADASSVPPPVTSKASERKLSRNGVWLAAQERKQCSVFSCQGLNNAR